MSLAIVFVIDLLVVATTAIIRTPSTKITECSTQPVINSAVVQHFIE